MARTDIARMLTGVGGPAPVQAMPGTAGFAEQFGAQTTAGMGQAIGALTRGGAPSYEETVAQTMGQLDLETPEGLSQLAKYQQISGDLAGAAQTAAKIQAIKQAEAQEDRAERGLEIREEQLAIQKAATDRELDIAESEAANAGVLRQLYIDQALENGNDALAKALATNAFPLEKATPILFGTSNAVIKAPTDDEAKAFDRVLNSSSFSEKIKDLKTGVFFKELSEETKQAIYFKAKELMTRQKMSTEDALERAITSIKLLDQIPEGSDSDKKEKLEVDRRGRPIQKQVEPQDDDAYLDLNTNT